MDTNNNVATAVLHLGKQSITIYHFCNDKKKSTVLLLSSPRLRQPFCFSHRISVSRFNSQTNEKIIFTCTSDNMCITHEEWCTVQMGGRQQSSTDMHLDAELAVDKGWERASTTKKSIMF